MRIKGLIFKLVSICILFAAISCKVENKNLQVSIYYDSSESSIAFAAQDLEQIFKSKNYTTYMNDVGTLSNASNENQIIISKNNEVIQKALKSTNARKVDCEEEQSYCLRVTQNGKYKSYWAIGADRIGAMYGGIHIGEIVKAFGLDAIKNEDKSPYIAKRGLKFNIPLDQRTPSHDDSGTAAQTNIVNMWDFGFWKEYLDVLARQRYNVLSLWSRHPFSNMIKLEDYPEVALKDVYNANGKVKEISIDQKIELWKKIMDYAWDRGIEIYIITWNIHMDGAAGKHGITEDENNEITKDYLRKSVEKIFLTYPKLAGIGVTAGENMDGISPDNKEQWMWETYGKGIQDVKEKQPNRHIRFIHRFWWTEFDKIDSRFGQLEDGYDMSFKYARARMYASYKPPFAENELLPNLPEDKSTWWNIRNDDIYNLRWCDPEYARQFILHLPKGKKTAGYYMGSDRYAWARESISKKPTSPRTLENEKHWFSFLLWGRMGYDPETPVELLKGLIKNRFPSADSEQLFTAWKSASQIIPLVNKFHWYSWDYLWCPEACTSTGAHVAIDGYHNINHFINTPVMVNSGLSTIVEYVESELQNKDLKGKQTPFEVAEKLELFAQKSLNLVKDFKHSENNELNETIGDIRAMSHLGKYYAFKIRGATNYKLFLETKKSEYKTEAIKELEKSLASWINYGKTLEHQYIKMNIAMHGVLDWDKLEEDVKRDIEIVRMTQ